MRFVARLWPCVAVSLALMPSGCASPNAKMASLERENTRLQAEKQTLTKELAALREKLTTTNVQAKHWENACGDTQKALQAHIEQLTQAQIRRQIVQRALTMAQTQLQAVAQGQAKAASEAVMSLRVARATTEEPLPGQP
jgi:chromosome segregation ATPase